MGELLNDVRSAAAQSRNSDCAAGYQLLCIRPEGMIDANIDLCSFLPRVVEHLDRSADNGHSVGLNRFMLSRQPHPGGPVVQT